MFTVFDYDLIVRHTKFKVISYFTLLFSFLLLSNIETPSIGENITIQKPDPNFLYLWSVDMLCRSLTVFELFV
jgi:hypothetical protein